MAPREGDGGAAGGGAAGGEAGFEAGRPAGGLDWAGLMRAGLTRASLGGLGLAPREFWDLTPAELALMLGIEPGRGGGMSRAGLEALMARFPDAPAGGD
ncbi:phage tail assembly chaperone [Paracoccus sanguinis]|uniref:Phage tail assembly chaperone n=3 Tax=Paracoccus sanguinis TaxID=1545044 RepID=A0A1H2XRV4_9RHOB|nr:phage conserved hypothetical protein [Paracoccus sanguinis]